MAKKWTIEEDKIIINHIEQGEPSHRIAAELNERGFQRSIDSTKKRISRLRKMAEFYATIEDFHAKRLRPDVTPEDIAGPTRWSKEEDERILATIKGRPRWEWMSELSDLTALPRISTLGSHIQYLRRKHRYSRTHPNLTSSGKKRLKGIPWKDVTAKSIQISEHKLVRIMNERYDLGYEMSTLPFVLSNGLLLCLYLGLRQLEHKYGRDFGREEVIEMFREVTGQDILMLVESEGIK